MALSSPHTLGYHLHVHPWMKATLVVRLSIAVVLVLLASACSSAATTAIPPAPASSAADVALQRDADVPDLPFADNPDPNACGIPTPYGGGTAWVTGAYRGQMVEPTVLLYDSHERLHVTGSVPSGTPVQVQLYQPNPVLDFYYVQSDTSNGPQKGWVPAPFLQFDPPSS
jgi:hypothetical protein